MDEINKKVALYRKAFDEATGLVKDYSALRELQELYLGQNKGIVAELSEEVKALKPEDVTAAGFHVDSLRRHIRERLREMNEAMGNTREGNPLVDLTLPGKFQYWGAPHPLRLFTRRVIDIFTQMGFFREVGPEIETDFYNFEVLDCPSGHIFRDQWGLLYINDDRLMRSHMLPGLVRALQKKKPPLRIINTGKIYRTGINDSGTRAMSFQTGGLMIDHGVNFSNLKGTLEAFLKSLFSDRMKIRFLPDYAPYAVPAARIEIQCPVCSGGDLQCWSCEGKYWIPALASGLIDPQVLKNINIDPEKFSGFFFSFDIDRMASLYYKVPDIKIYYENDLKFIRQFSRQ